MGRARVPAIVILALSCATSLWAATPWTLQQSLTESTGAASDHFGWSVSMGNNVLVVGAPQATPPGATINQGAAYIFVNPGTGWPSTPTAVLSEVPQTSQDVFGTSVAISPDGKTVVVGATSHSVSSTKQNVGAAFVFVEPAGGWATTSSYTPTAQLSASDGLTGDSFGSSVAINGAANTIVVGAPQLASDALEGGAVYIFQENPKTGWKTTAHFVAKLTASNGGPGHYLGTSVAIDGNTVVAGAPYASAGTTTDVLCTQCGVTYVFVRGTNWTTGTETAQLYALDGAADDALGTSVAISLIKVSGVSVSIVVAGAPDAKIGTANRLQGAAYVFVEPASLAWVQYQTQTAKLIAKDGAEFDELGTAVAISGSLVIAGAPDKTVDASGDEGEVYAFQVNPATGRGQQTQELSLGTSVGSNDKLGYSVSLYVSGGVPAVLTGAPFETVGLNTSQGAAYVWGP